MQGSRAGSDVTPDGQQPPAETASSGGQDEAKAEAGGLSIESDPRPSAVSATSLEGGGAEFF